ncbi:MAG: hypothetical protein HY094_08575 [Candidatus Melainabacteria bacterium]|nr:hypothetical protein [Candidatus Melainabacteria bacterium]
MFAVTNLNLSHQWIYRVAPPKGQYHIDFELNSKSKQKLKEAAGNLSSEGEVKNFEDAIEQAACMTLFKMDGQELDSNEIPPYIRLTIDPTNKSRLFGFQIKNGEGNKLIISKVEVLGEN